ncbi:transketolase [Aequitasia blattaphilus]|uniref:Transketolase n=1 Tax=Aequitasia blattaphilus TaxID=2949332 RepID=A0ABT1EBW3_9FIRM|nr:transketolase C-terminal domain-containing protein [Aequitasia blattaphilus]MCP1103336.1 transketolase [Aequitasia blattaphilus]MCR8615976.1 transketolase [Aequitasia blattaphilus]
MAVKTTFDFDQMLSNAREAYGEELMKLADEGKEFLFTYSDNVAPSSCAGKMITKYPDRCFNFGIAEPNQVGASAGMALAGHTVFAQVFGPFLPLRAADQIHTDIAYNDVNVRLIGTHSGVTAGGGPTHNDIADLALYRAIPNLTVVVPADAGQCRKVIRASLDYEGPMIIRIDRAGSPDIYAGDYDFEIGKAIDLIEGDDATIISTGSSLYECMMASKILKDEGISVGVLDMHTIKPLDTEAILRVANRTGNIVTVEDHSINGGLGGAVAEVLCEASYKGKFKRVAMPDQFSVLGDSDEIYAYYGMDRKGIVATIKKMLG